MGVETTCGALAGAVAAISVRFTKTKAHENPEVRDICKAFLDGFSEKRGSIICGPLKELYRDERFRCLPVIEMAAEELGKIMEGRESKEAGGGRLETREAVTRNS
jgi:C_GCAxxG_C_C family probable redox protein